MSGWIKAAGPAPPATRTCDQGERLAIDLTHRNERVDAPVGHHAENVGLEQLHALLGLDLPGAHIDEAVLLETPKEDLSAEAGLVVERHVRADDLHPVDARCSLQKRELGHELARGPAELGETADAGDPLAPRCR